ncbi:unnamed protein product [Rhodiola kirilowii]
MKSINACLSDVGSALDRKGLLKLAKRAFSNWRKGLNAITTSLNQIGDTFEKAFEEELVPLAAFGWVMASHLSLYPAVLIIPVILLLGYGSDSPPRKLFQQKLSFNLYACHIATYAFNESQKPLDFLR